MVPVIIIMSVIFARGFLRTCNKEKQSCRDYCLIRFSLSNINRKKESKQS